MIMGLSGKHVTDICLFGKMPQQCRYLDDGIIGGKRVFFCVKKTLNRQIIDNEIKEFEEECKQKNINPHQSQTALGNNCAGFLPLKHLEQGYDVPDSDN